MTLSFPSSFLIQEPIKGRVYFWCAVTYFFESMAEMLNQEVVTWFMWLPSWLLSHHLKGTWNWEIKSNLNSSVMRSVHFDFLSQDILWFHTAAEEKGTSFWHCNWFPDVCACVCKTSHCVCCAQCCVNLWTDSNGNLQIEKTAMMATNKLTPNLLFLSKCLLWLP